MLDSQILSSSPSKAGSSEGSPLRPLPSNLDEDIIPCSQWGASISNPSESLQFSLPIKRCRRRKRLPERFRRIFPVEASPSSLSRSTLPDVSPIKQSSFYSPQSKWSPKKRPASPEANAPESKRVKVDVASRSHRTVKSSANRASRRRGQDFGINKGVSHGIKRPQKKKKRKNKSKRRKEERKRTRGEEHEGEENSSRIENSPSTKIKPQPHLLQDEKSFYTPNKEKSIYTPPSKRGSLVLSSEHAKVSYEISGGQMVFRRHRGGPLTPVENKRRAPLKSTPLFTPEKNFLKGTPEKKSVVKSPLKFSVIEEEEENTAGISLTDIIADLNSQYDGIHGDSGVKDSINNEDIEKIAIETEEQIRSLYSQEEIYVQVPVVSQDEKKVIYSDDHDRDDLMKNISNIISNIPAQKPILQIEDENVLPKEESAHGYFPIFYKESAMTGLSLAEPKEKSAAKKCLKSDKEDGLTQMVIDAGQVSIGAQLCLTCSTVYTLGDPEDERSHRLIHDGLLDTISFNGWANERIVRYLPEIGRRIIMVDPGDKKAGHWEKNKVVSVLSVVDKAIGSNTDLDKCASPMAFLFIADKKVVGFLLAEKVSKAYRTNGDETTYNQDESFPVLAGVSRLWVMSEYQRQGVASKLVDAFRENYYASFGARYIKMEEFAFSQTTPNGTAFASKYTGASNFLMYVSNDETV